MSPAFHCGYAVLISRGEGDAHLTANMAGTSFWFMCLYTHSLYGLQAIGLKTLLLDPYRGFKYDLASANQVYTINKSSCSF